MLQNDEILFGTSATSRKARNLARDPRVVLSIEDEERNERGFQRHLLIHGTASMKPGPDERLMDRLAMKYVGLHRHPLALRDSPSMVVVRVAVDRISGVRPWVSATRPPASVLDPGHLRTRDEPRSGWGAGMSRDAG